MRGRSRAQRADAEAGCRDQVLGAGAQGRKELAQAGQGRCRGQERLPLT